VITKAAFFAGHQSGNPWQVMMTAIRKGALGFLVIAALVGATACSPAPLKAPLTFQKDIQLPKDTGAPSIDLLALDSRNGLLYAPHGSNNALDIVDTRAERYVGSIPGLPGIKGIALTSDPNIVFTSNASDGTVSVVDVKALKTIASINVGGAPDAIDYDPVHALVVVSLGTDNHVAFIDEKTRNIQGKLTLDGKPELMAVDQKQGLIYLAINDKNKVVEIDPVSRSIVKTYSGCDINSPAGLVYDPDNQRLFVANAISHSANVVSVIDVLLERCLGSVDVDHSPDQAAFNSHLHHLYVANAGSNNVSVIDAVSLKPLGIVGTGKQAGTIAADPTTDKIAVAATRAGIIAIYHDP
jgi:YVTN family beta-propeller protein